MAAETGPTSDPLCIHATTVAHAGHAALIRGKAGSGKSSLAMEMLALGATLVSDDQTLVWSTPKGLLADAPASLRGRIEARFVGILTAPAQGATHVRLVIDMDVEETERLPPHREVEIMGVMLPLQRKVALPHFPAAIMAYLEHGRNE